MFNLSEKTVFCIDNMSSTAIQHAVSIFSRDFEKVFSAPPIFAAEGEVKIYRDDTILYAEQFAVDVQMDKVSVRYKDELGAVYALLYMSRKFLGVDDFWFWAEKEPHKNNKIQITEGEYVSPKARVRYRGWFVNDEVCLIGWSKVYPPSKEIWECVFETLLRLGGNMVIPGTDLPRSGCHFDTASEMGLYITHHHAEPLGAEMFLRAYPEEDASYDKNPQLFEKLWADAVEKYKDKKIVWTLGFRGQGDAPFWHNDPKYTTDEARGEVIRKVIDKQYEMICEKVENPVCAVYLYGEITELYEGGYLKLPKDFIKIWSDNGYGKMVTRRQGRHNPRIPSLPKEDGKHGLYYHITFHDLQASSHLCMLGNPPELVNSELDTAFSSGADEYLLLNCGNIRPHIYMLDLVAQKWRSGEVDIDEFKSDFAKRYFRGNESAARMCYDKYFTVTPKYGVNDDDRGGDEFFTHPARCIITQWIKYDNNNACSGLIWAAGDKPFDEQIDWYKNICGKSAEDFQSLYNKCAEAAQGLIDYQKPFFIDNIMFQAGLMMYTARGCVKICEAHEIYVQGNLPRTFVVLSDAIDEFKNALALMRAAEHGKWENFYSADWLTNVAVTAEELSALRKWIRMKGDAPDYFRWYKNYVMPKTERSIYLENTQRRTLDDDELAQRLRIALQNGEI